MKEDVKADQENQQMIDTTNSGAKQSVNERFFLNLNFKSNQFRLNLPIPALEEEGVSNKKVKVVQDRAHSIDATIIKRMKTHKKMDFNELLSEVISALSMF